MESGERHFGRPAARALAACAADRVVAMQLEEQERRIRAVAKEFRDIREDLPKAKK